MLLAFREPGAWGWFGLPLPWILADQALKERAWRLAGRIVLVMAATALISYKSFLITTVHLVGLSQLYPILLYWLKYGTLKYWRGPGPWEYHPVARCLNCGSLVNLAGPGEFAATRCAACGQPFKAFRLGWKRKFKG